jgi:GntR family transcriptional regulator
LFPLTAQRRSGAAGRQCGGVGAGAAATIGGVSGPSMPHRLDRSSPLPLWAQLADDLVARLQAGQFGERFPTEHELGAEYGVSRHTVRDAVRRLREDGLLSAERGRGTFVRPGRIDQPLGAIYSLFREVEARGMQQTSRVRALDVRTDDDVCARLRLPEGTDLVFLERLRLADEEPLALDRVWLQRPLGDPLIGADLHHTGVYDVLAAASGVRLTGGRERIGAVVPTGEERALLGTGPDVAALTIERTGELDGEPVEWRTTLVRGDRFAVTAEWTARHGYHMEVTVPRV